MRPNPYDYNFTVADLQRFEITPTEAARMLVQQTGGQAPNAETVLGADPVVALLTQLVKSQRRANALYGPLGWSLAAWTKLQLFQTNPVRAYLLIQNVGSGDLLVLFEGGPTSPQDFSSNTDQLTTDQTRAVRVVAGGYYEPLVSPTNAVTIFTLGTATDGVAIEGA